MDDLQILVKYVQDNLSDQLDSAPLAEEYFYQSLTLAAIDAVFSAQARYPSVQSIVKRYCDKFNLTRIRPSRSLLPMPECQESIKALIQKMEQAGTQYFVVQVFKNKSKTSGRFKAEILLELLQKIDNLDIQNFQDIQQYLNNPNKQQKLVRSITEIHGIGEATSRYFLMLAGDERMVKPDTMIMRFIKNALGRNVEEAEAVQLVQAVSNLFIKRYPNMSPRLLDNIIWSWQRNQITTNINPLPKPKNTTNNKPTTIISAPKQLTVPQKTQQAMFKRYSPGTMLTSSQIKDNVLADYDIPPGSVMPPDYCCNKWNKDPSSGIYHIFFFEKLLNKYRLLPKMDITKSRQRGLCP